MKFIRTLRFVAMIVVVFLVSYDIRAQETYKRVIDFPQGSGPFPVIIYSHGSGGLNVERF